MIRVTAPESARSMFWVARFVMRAGFVSLAVGLVLALSAVALPAADEPEVHWAFQPVRAAVAPFISSKDLTQSPLDAFVLAPLEANGLSLAAPASRSTWLRRVTFDLIGVPPSPADLQAFLDDQSPDAFDRVVDRLLADPRYGETWGRLWLDLVRFAETAGFNADPTRPLAYKYRDYVIKSRNRDTPYDRFIAEQLAGDELFPDDPEALAATGYCRMWPDESNASNILLARQSALNDLAGNVGAVFLGLSIGCAQCHDHKFDPLLQTDFYQLQAFFAGITLEDQVPVGDHAALENFRSEHAAWAERVAPIRQELHAIETAARVAVSWEKRLKFPAVVLEAIDAAPEQRTAYQRQLVFWSERQIPIKEADLIPVMDDFARERYEVLQREWKAAKKSEPRPSRSSNVMAVREISTEPPVTRLLGVGSYEDPQEETPPGFPVVLRRDVNDVPRITPPRAETSGRRAALAAWLADPAHPLTHRVLVNRLWQGHFGRGLVENANDFGTQTAEPTHPELLDWLVSEFLRHGQEWKPLHREIVLSATYRQASVTDEASIARGNEADLDNRLYWRFPRQRLTAERIRDGWLAVSDQLTEELYGDGVRPELPPNFAGGWKASEREADRNRRSVYIFAKRNLPYPMLQAFDLPDMHESCGCRTQTVIAPQALLLLNNELVLQAAEQTVKRARELAPSADPQAVIAALWRLVYSRDPNADELTAAQRFLSKQTDVNRGAETESAGNPLDHEAAAWTDLAHSLLNANEALYVD